jgi:hypothetical protein
MVTTRLPDGPPKQFAGLTAAELADLDSGAQRTPASAGATTLSRRAGLTALLALLRFPRCYRTWMSTAERRSHGQSPSPRSAGERDLRF